MLNNSHYDTVLLLIKLVLGHDSLCCKLKLLMSTASFFKKKCGILFSGLGSSVVTKPCSVTVANEVNKKKVDVIDLTIESSSDEEEDPPAKRKCIFMSETQGSPTKGFVNFKVVIS